ncbi:hypothetical protein FRC0522_00508 [Corynebacterium diphtheriae]|nr:hypothetical protein FRC0522_00508 [Corynebacterium diphtheriae]
MGIEEPAFEGKFTGVFVDDDNLVRTGRAWMEVTSGNGVVHIPLSAEHHRLREQVQRDAQAVAEGKAAFDETLRKVKAAESTTLPAAEAAKKSQLAAESAAARVSASEAFVSESKRQAEEAANTVSSATREVRASSEAAERVAQQASQSEKSAGGYASEAHKHAGEAGVAQRAAEAARDKALASEQAAGEHVKAAAQSVEQAAIHEQGAMAARSGVTDALNGAKEARTGAEKARDEARQAAESAIKGIKPDSVQKSMLAVDLRGEIDAKADSVTMEKQLEAKADLSVVDEKIRAIPKPVSMWGELQGKPTKFPPESHKHKITDVTGLQGVLDEKTTKAYVDGKIRSLPKPATSWSEIAGKPSDFRPKSHTHSIREVSGLDAALQNKASGLDMDRLKSEVAALRTQIPAKRIEVVSKLPFRQDPNTIYFEEA